VADTAAAQAVLQQQQVWERCRWLLLHLQAGHCMQAAAAAKMHEEVQEKQQQVTAAVVNTIGLLLCSDAG
jgi:hypothetical protein